MKLIYIIFAIILAILTNTTDFIIIALKKISNALYNQSLLFRDKIK